MEDQSRVYSEWLERNAAALRCEAFTFRELFAEVLEELDDKEG